MPTQYIRGANRTAQWYQGSYPGASVFSRLDKFLLHTTETRGWPGYGGGASAPNATYYPQRREIRQHFGTNRSARALRDPSSTVVRENRDNVFQLEIICYSDFILAKKVEGLWVGDLTASHMRDIAAIILQCHRDWGLPLQSTVRWREGRQGYYNDVRLSGSQYDAYRGILGHVHASGNQHWDPGGFRYSRLENALGWQFANHPVYGTVPWPGADPIDIPPFLEDDVSEADVLNGLRKAVNKAATRDDGYGQGLGDDLKAILAPMVAYQVREQLDRELPKSMVEDEYLGLAVARLRRGVERLEAGQLDPTELAGALAPLLPSGNAPTVTQLVEALTKVLGSLDEPDAPA